MIEKIYIALSKEDQEDVLKYAVSKLLPNYTLVNKEELAMYAAAYDAAYIPKPEPEASEAAAIDPPPFPPKQGGNRRPVTVLGYKYESMAAAASDNNMSIQRVHYRAKSKGLSKVEALEELILKEKHLGRPIELTIGGESLKAFDGVR